MTFADYLAAHPDQTVQTAREWLRERAGGPRTTEGEKMQNGKRD